MQSPILFHVAFSLFIRISLLNLIQTNEITSALRGKNNIIYLNEKSTQTIRLKSIFNIQNQNLTTSSKSQKIFWSFKRIYALPNFHESNIYDVNNVFVKTTNELSQNELMISLDSEVQDNLKNKYSISEGEEEENLGENENANLDSKNDKFDLIIRNITYADSGLYKCNLWNQKTLYYYLTVSSSISKPEIKIEHTSLKSNTIPENMLLETSNLIIKCTSRYAYPFPVIKWFKSNLELIPNENRINFKLVDKETNTVESTLTLKNMNSSLNSNNITCKLVQIQQDLPSEITINNSKQQPDSTELVDMYLSEQQLWQTSDAILLNIAFKPIISVDMVKSNSTSSVSDEFVSHLMIKLNETNKTIYLYEKDVNVVFYCKFKSNPYDRVSIVWKLNGVVQNQSDLANSGVFIWEKRSNRKDLNVKQMDLTCDVENKIGVSSFNIDVNMLYEPRIKLDRSSYEVDEYSQVQLNCLADGSPLPFLTQWRQYQNSSAFSVATNSSLLEFKSIKHTENAGVYVCTAVNQMNDSFGMHRQIETKFEVNINVRFKPQMNILHKKIAASSSEDLTSKSQISQNISCITMSNPEPIFNWFSNGVKLGTSTVQNGIVKYKMSQIIYKSKNLYENILTIYSLREEDLNRKYVCETMNLLGSSQIEIELVPKSRPDKPTEIKATRVDFMTISLAWSAGFDGGLEQTFVLQLNNSFIELNTQNSFYVSNDSENYFSVIKYSQSLINITKLNYNSVYSLRLMAKNKLGSSDWSEFLHVRTQEIEQPSAQLISEFDTLFLNVPKNRLEFTFRPQFMQNKEETFVDAANQSLPAIHSLIPVCLNLSVVLYKANVNNEIKFNFRQCLNMPGYLSQKQFQFEALSEAELQMQGASAYNTATVAAKRSEIFNPKLVKSMRVAVCFQVKPSVCTKYTSALIDTYNKISHSSQLSNKKNDEHENSFFEQFNLSNKLKTLISANSIIPLTLIISICVCIVTLLIILFVTIVFCMRKRNFKMCKHLLSLQSGDLNNKSDGDDKKNRNNKNKNNKNKDDKNDKNNKPKKIISTSKVDDSKSSPATNKTFNMDVGCVSAPMASTASMNGSSQLTNSTNSDLNPTINTFTNNSNKKRTFTAALTATATNILSNSIGKHKVNEILVTEDEEQQQKISNKKFTQKCHQEAEFTVDGIEITNQELSIDNEIKLDTQHMQVMSNTPSTAISNCSSNSNNTGHYMYDQHDHGHHLTTHQLSMYNKGLTLIDTFNSGSSSTNSASNSDPVAINNSLSSNSTAESPTYGYNVTSGATLNMHAAAAAGKHNYSNDLNMQQDNFFYIKANLSSQQNNSHAQYDQNNSNNFMQIVDEDSYVKANHNLFKQQSLRNKVGQANQSVGKYNNISSNLSNNSASNTSSNTNGFIEQPESGYSTPSRHKKVVYEVIV